MRRYAIDLVIRRHDVQGVGRLDRCGEGRKENFAECAFGDGGRPCVGAALGLTVAGHVFEGGEHSAGCKGEGVPLKAPYRRDTELAHEIGVFAVCFLDTAPARIASDVDNGGQG